MTGASLMPTIVAEMQAHDLFHVKDRAETWKAQYPNGLEYPMLSDFAIYERCVTQPPPPPPPS